MDSSKSTSTRTKLIVAPYFDGWPRSNLSPSTEIRRTNSAVKFWYDTAGAAAQLEVMCRHDICTDLGETKLLRVDMGEPAHAGVGGRPHPRVWDFGLVSPECRCCARTPWRYTRGKVDGGLRPPWVHRQKLVPDGWFWVPGATHRGGGRPLVGSRIGRCRDLAR